VVVLILLPVAGMVGAATIFTTARPSPDRIATNRMGQADLLVYPGEGGTEQALRSKLPAGSRLEPIVTTAGTLVVPGLAVSVSLVSEDPAGLARGMLTLLDGRWPTAPGEIAVSRSFANLAHASIGSSVEIRGLGASTVVGFIEDELGLTTRIALADPSVARAAAADNSANWLVGLPAGTDPNELDPALVPLSGTSASAQFVVTSRAQSLADASALGPTTIVPGGLALLDAALVAAAAFAVGVRRRQRELGLLAAAGATPRQLAVSVLAEAVVLGSLGALLGVLVGIAGGLAFSPFLDELTGHRNPALVLDPAMMLIAAVLGLLAALSAALAPARAAARLPVLAALSGRRPPTASPRRSFGIGVGLVGLGIALTAIGAAVRLGGDSGLSVWLLLGGAVLGTLGFGSSSSWFLGQLERTAARLPLASRIALRDTARARSRNGPLVTAMLAATAATIALAAYQSSVEVSNLAHWRPTLLADQVFISGAGAAQAGPEAVRQLGATAGARIPGAGSDARFIWVSPTNSADPNLPLVTQNVTVGDADVLRALGGEAALDDLAAGKVIVLSEKPADLTSVTVHIDPTDGSTGSKEVVPARVVALGVTGVDLPGAVIPLATAERLGIPAGQSQRYVLCLGHPVSDAELAAVGSIVGQYPDTWTDSARPPQQAGAGFRLALIVASLLFALTVTGIAVALGEAESRPEQRTLLAVGADPRLRRRITAARAGIIALLGGLLAVPAGLLPIWGLLLSRKAPLVIPGPEIVAVVGLLPFLAIVATYVLSRPIPDWSAFRGRPS